MDVCVACWFQFTIALKSLEDTVIHSWSAPKINRLLDMNFTLTDIGICQSPFLDPPKRLQTTFVRNDFRLIHEIPALKKNPERKHRRGKNSYRKPIWNFKNYWYILLQEYKFLKHIQLWLTNSVRLFLIEFELSTQEN